MLQYYRIDISEGIDFVIIGISKMLAFIIDHMFVTDGMVFQ